MAQITTRWERVAGVTSFVRTSGPASAKDAVVFVHGNPGSGEDWTDLVARTGDFARAVAPDMPGYGKADRPHDFDYTVQGYARHLEGLLGALGVERAHLVLHDFGGPWGLVWASEHLERVASLTLVNVGVAPGYRWHKFARVWRTPILGELSQLVASRFSFRLALQRDNPRPFPPGFLDRMYDDFDGGMRRAVLKLYRATNDFGVLVEHVRSRPGFKKVPTLVVWGEGDAYIPVKYAEVQREFFDVRAVKRVARCGHWPMVDEPEIVGEAITSFLKERVG